jgi:hypothetical protein
VNRHYHDTSRTRWKCERVLGEMEAWSLGALEPEEMRHVERHLRQCDARPGIRSMH